MSKVALKPEQTVAEGDHASGTNGLESSTMSKLQKTKVTVAEGALAVDPIELRMASDVSLMSMIDEVVAAANDGRGIPHFIRYEGFDLYAYPGDDYDTVGVRCDEEIIRRRKLAEQQHAR